MTEPRQTPLARKRPEQSLPQVAAFRRVARALAGSATALLRQIEGAERMPARLNPALPLATSDPLTALGDGPTRREVNEASSRLHGSVSARASELGSSQASALSSASRATSARAAVPGGSRGVLPNRAAASSSRDAASAFASSEGTAGGVSTSRTLGLRQVDLGRTPSASAVLPSAVQSSAQQPADSRTLRARGDVARQAAPESTARVQPSNARRSLADVLVDGHPARHAPSSDRGLDASLRQDERGVRASGASGGRSNARGVGFGPHDDDPGPRGTSSPGDGMGLSTEPSERQQPRKPRASGPPRPQLHGALERIDQLASSLIRKPTTPLSAPRWARPAAAAVAPGAPPLASGRARRAVPLSREQETADPTSPRLQAWLRGPGTPSVEEAAVGMAAGSERNPVGGAGAALLQADDVAELVNDALLEQALLYGVDLS